MDTRIAAEQIDFVRNHSKCDGRLADVGAVDLILDAISGLIGDPQSLANSSCFRVAIGMASRCSTALTVSSVTWHRQQISR